MACVLAEPVMTNIGMVLTQPGFWGAAQALIKQFGSLLVLDETHTFISGSGGYAQAHGLQPDALVIGKPHGRWFAVRGMKTELDARATQAAALFDEALAHLLHLALLNRGVLITPFHNMLLCSPAPAQPMWRGCWRRLKRGCSRCQGLWGQLKVCAADPV